MIDFNQTNIEHTNSLTFFFKTDNKIEHVSTHFLQKYMLWRVVNMWD